MENTQDNRIRDRRNYKGLDAKDETIPISVSRHNSLREYHRTPPKETEQRSSEYSYSQCSGE